MLCSALNVALARSEPLLMRAAGPTLAVTLENAFVRQANDAKARNPPHDSAGVRIAEGLCVRPAPEAIRLAGRVQRAGVPLTEVSYAEAGSGAAGASTVRTTSVAL